MGAGADERRIAAVILPRPRFTLRLLFVFIALASLLFALVAMFAPHRRERRLASELESLGASVTLVDDTPRWLFLAQANDFARVDSIDLVGVAVDDRVVELLAGCTQVRFVDLSYSAITDTQLARLHTLSGLRVLNLSNTQVTDASIPTLIGHESLVDLDITATQITAEAVEKLQTTLPHLDIDH